MVNQTPLCIWDYESTIEKNLQFVNKIDHLYFEFLAQTLYQKLQTKKNNQRAAIAIRSAFSHGLETLFSLLGAYIQAPYCVQGWILHCNNKELNDLIDSINTHKKVPSVFKQDILDWTSISENVFRSLILENEEKKNEIVNGFASLWRGFAHNFTDKSFIKEYNSIKHGFRVTSGGFSVQLGSKGPSEGNNNQQSMHLLGSSKYGSTFHCLKAINNSINHYFLVRYARNWDPEDMVWALHLISLSISNVISAIKIFNGIHPKDIKYIYPSDSKIFQKPIENTRTLGVTSMKGYLYGLSEEIIQNYTKQEMVDLYTEGKFLKKIYQNVVLKNNSK